MVVVRGLTEKKALIFRITHINNVQWLLRNGLRCKNSEELDPEFVGVGNQELIDKRASRSVPISPGGTLADYIPFYFTPFSMMMYNIKTGYGGIIRRKNAEVVILVSSLRGLAEKGVSAVYTDRHAYLRTANFFSSMDDLGKIDWPLLRRRDFKRDAEDPGKTDRYQAEALVFRHMPVECLTGIVCYGETEQRVVERSTQEAGVDLKVVAQPSWYFS